jgi:acyl-coenzyme A synthetase/AMP-(fatty) acid ligase
MFALLHLLIGSTCVLPPVDPTRVADADPRLLGDAIERFGVTSMFASPALLTRLARYLADSGRRMPTLRHLVSGGAPVGDEVVSCLHDVLDEHTHFHVTYGATEALAISTIEAREILAETRVRTRAGAGTCVGRPVDGVEVRILDLVDGPVEAWTDALALPFGRVGEITVTGPAVSRGYHAAPEADRRYKIVEPGRVWHRTGDLGWIDEAGRIWFCGRAHHRVPTADGPLDSVRCEGILDAHPDVHRTALVGVRRPDAPGPERRAVVCVELAEGVPAKDEERVAGELRHLAERHAMTRQLDTFLFHPSFPVDIRHNAKIHREELAGWAIGQLRGAGHRSVGLAGLVPVAGWLFLLYGVLAHTTAGGLPHPALTVLFWVDVFLSVVVHGLQVPFALRRARHAGCPTGTSVLLTLLLGATWWRSLPPPARHGEGA